jgi:hypothetical protein
MVVLTWVKIAQIASASVPTIIGITIQRIAVFFLLFLYVA